MSASKSDDFDEPDDGSSSLPEFFARESFTDCAGKRREFDLSVHALPNHGFSGQALEVTAAEHGGYIFRSFAEGSLVTALGRLSGAVRAGIAQRFLIKNGNDREMPFERMCGRIDAEGLVVDGKLLSWAALQRLLSEYEGWDFELRIPFEPDR
jgi:hypothetical protein